MATDPASRALRVLSIVEGTWVTGPLKPLLMFAQGAAHAGTDGTRAQVSLAVTTRVSPSRETPDNALLRTAREQDVPIEALTERRAWDPALLRRYADLITRVRPDIVETHQVKCHFILRLALALKGLRQDFRWIAFHHGYTRASLKLSLYESLDCWSLRKPDRIVTFCQPFARELAKRGACPERISVIPNAIDRPADPEPARVAALRTALGVGPGDLLLLSVGRLSPEKGHAHLIQALSGVRRAGTVAGKVRLALVGDGPERRPLETQAASLGVDAAFLGHQSDVWPYYFAADVFVLPSLTEGSPLALIEAMHAGCTILASSVGGVPELVENERSALLTAPGDAAALRQCLTRVIDSPSLRAALAAEGREDARQLSPEAYRDRLFSIYRSVLAC